MSTFGAITGASPEVARSFLEMTNGNFERAIELFYENPDLATGVGVGLSSATTTTQPQPASRSNLGRQDSAGVIHIDSDDDDMQLDNDSDQDDDDDENDARAAAAQAAALAQEEEDAAMAKRLQEELYQENQGSGAGGDDVRAPIARTTETLVAPGGPWVGGDDHGVEAALLEQLRRRRQQQGPRKLRSIYRS